MKKFFKSGGKQQIPYKFNYKSDLFDVSNPFLAMRLKSPLRIKHY